MAGPKRLPVEVVAKAASLTRQYTVGATPKRAAAAPKPASPKPLEKKAKLVAALKRLHPMD